jgi:NAD(P)-dependent dehydrogenase (short-subunit alcohol dehydrogenase family)
MSDLANLVLGKTAVVTGASRGLGAALATLGASLGMRLALCSRGAPVLPSDENILSERLDVSHAPAVERFAQVARERFGRMDVWINNAGILEPIGPLAEVKAEDLQALIHTNVLGSLYGSQSYARLARKQGGGILLNISSGAARHAYRGWGGYCASKAAVDRFSECMALEEPQLRVHSVAPGVIETEMQECIRSQNEADFPDVERFRTMHAKGHLLSPEQAAQHLLRLAFDPAKQQDQVCVDVRP